MPKGAVMAMLSQKSGLKNYVDNVQFDWDDRKRDEFCRAYPDKIYNEIDVFYNNVINSAEKLPHILREMEDLANRVNNLY
jgi:hypothetical protein